MKNTIRQESSFNLILDQIPSGLLRQTTGKKSRIDFVNHSLCQMLNYTKVEFLSLDPDKIFANKRTYNSVIKQVMDGKKICDRQVDLKDKEGLKVSAWMTAICVKGHKRYVDFVFKAAGIPHKIEKELANSKEMFKTVFNNSAVAIIVADKDQHIVAWNPFAQKMLGMGWEDLFNKPLSALFPAEEWNRFKNFQVQKKGPVSHIETVLLKKKDHALDVNLSLSVVKNLDGEIVGSIGIVHDVSSQKKVQNMLLESKKVAEAASEAKTMFLANMSHEVRTPMNTILGMVGLTLDTELTVEQRDNLLTVKNAADILLSLLNDILDLSRVEAGKIQLENIEIEIERIVSSVCKTMDILARNKGLSLRWVVDEDVPLMVKGDPVRVRQILVNLINNAVKFTKEGIILVEVKVKKREGDQCELLFAVKDQGIGIETDKQEAIFDVFTQEDASTTRQFGGTGLGLSICKKLLELMHGRIWVESSKGKGSTFYFLIPYVIVKKDDIPEALREESIEAQLMAQITKKKSEEQASRITQLNILLAEDNLVNQKMTQRILEKRGWRVVVANNGQEVLDMMEQQTFDLILMDAQMPVMDGFESTMNVRKKEEGTGKRIPIVALTARAMSGDRNKCLDAGMDGYVSKPIERDQLFETIQSFFI